MRTWKVRVACQSPALRSGAGPDARAHAGAGIGAVAVSPAPLTVSVPPCAIRASQCSPLASATSDGPDSRSPSPLAASGPSLPKNSRALRRSK
eukprot:8333890-Alexandrium_andersonii.AAC.1